MMVCFGVGFASCFALRLYLIWENRRRDQVGGAVESEADTGVMLNMMDKTDKEILQFRYVY